MVRMTATIFFFFLALHLARTENLQLIISSSTYIYIMKTCLKSCNSSLFGTHAKSLYEVFFFQIRLTTTLFSFSHQYSARIANLHVNSFSCRIIPRKILLNSRTLALSYLARTEILHITSLQVRMTITALFFLVFYSARGENLQIKTFSNEHYVTQYLL